MWLDYRVTLLESQVFQMCDTCASNWLKWRLRDTSVLDTCFRSTVQSQIQSAFIPKLETSNFGESHARCEWVWVWVWQLPLSDCPTAIT